jgi:hypothetical protein
MEIPAISSGSFEFYEGLRVLFPGTFAVALYTAIGTTFGFLAHPSDIGALPAIVGILVAGMLFLFLDIPSSAAVFRYESPVLVLQSWGHRPPKGSNHINVYYEILDTLVPSGIRTRTYYLGVIYRIGYEAVYLLSLPALTVLVLGDLFPTVGKERRLDADASRLVLVMAGVAIIATFGAAVAGRYNDHRRKGVEGLRPRLERVLNDIRAEVPSIDRLLLLAAIAVAVLYASHELNHYWAVASVATAASVWAFRYHHGVRRLAKGTDPNTGTKLPPRQNLHGVSASLLFTVALLTALACVLSNLPERGAVSASACVGWAGSLVAAAILIQFRSHEKKLLGSYGLQRTWLLRNRGLIEQDYYGSQPPAAPDRDPLGSSDTATPPQRP